MSTQIDVQIGGVDYVLMRGDGAYEGGSARTQLEMQEIIEGNRQFTSAQDRRSLFQTSWLGGTRWEIPLLSEQNIDSYNIGEGFDPTLTPGTLEVLSDVDPTSQALLAGWSSPVFGRSSDVLFLGEAGGSQMKLIACSAGVYTDLGSSGVPNAEVPLQVTFDNQSAGGWFYTQTTTNIYRSNGSTSALVTAFTGWLGSNIFIHNGELFARGGTEDAIYRINDPLGTPALEKIFDDGMGYDILNNDYSVGGTTHFTNYWNGPKLAISTAEGIYMVKNVLQDGLPTPIIYRIDRDTTGTYIGNPIATLQPGTIALDIFYHLGVLLISATKDYMRVRENDASTAGYARVNVYALTTSKGLAVVGSAAGGPNPTDSVWKFLGARDAEVYMGGNNSVWVYDAVRGGLHRLFTRSGSGNGFFSGMYQDIISNQSYMLFTLNNWSGGDQDQYRFAEDSTDIGTGQTRQLDSNLFDFNLPMEFKSINEVTLAFDDVIPANETWTVYLSADEGAFASVATFTSADTETTITKEFTPVKGSRFRYRLEYTAAADGQSPPGLRQLMFKAVTGEMHRFWILTINGRESANVNNLRQDPGSVFDNLQTLKQNADPVDFVDLFERYDKTPAASTKVRVQNVSIQKGAPGESEARVVLVEV